MNYASDVITVLIVDDHPLVREGIGAFLCTQTDLRVVGEAAGGADAVRLAAELLPDVVLMDLLMPGVGGIEATRAIKENTPSAQVIILTSFHDDAHLLPALRAGALSYLLKDIAAPELVAAIRKAARGEITLDAGVAAQIIAAYSGAGDADKKSEPGLALSTREREVLGRVAQGESNAVIADALFISERTVKSHVSNILAKLRVTDRTQAAVYAWRQGIVRREQE